MNSLLLVSVCFEFGGPVMNECATRMRHVASSVLLMFCASPRTAARETESCCEWCWAKPGRCRRLCRSRYGRRRSGRGLPTSLLSPGLDTSTPNLDTRHHPQHHRQQLHLCIGARQNSQRRCACGLNGLDATLRGLDTSTPRHPLPTPGQLDTLDTPRHPSTPLDTI